MIPIEGIACDGAHSEKNKLSQYQAIDLESGKILFRQDLGYATVNIAEYLGLVETIKWVVFKVQKKTTIYCDSLTAIKWVKEKYTASKKFSKRVMQAEFFILTCWEKIKHLINIVHWDSSKWGENPADFGNK